MAERKAKRRGSKEVLAKIQKGEKPEDEHKKSSAANNKQSLCRTHGRGFRLRHLICAHSIVHQMAGKARIDRSIDIIGL